MTSIPSYADTRELLNAAFRIGRALDRKFEVSDLTPTLRQAAVAYAATYEGDFDYMIAMRDNVGGLNYLSDQQCRGTLNCLIAEGKRRLAARPKVSTVAAKDQPVVKAPVAVLATVPDGRYRITLTDDVSIALRIAADEWVEDKYGAGTRKLSLRTGGSDSEREWTGVGAVRADGSVAYWKAASGNVKAAVTVLERGSVDGKWLVFGLAFAQAGDHCFRCGKELDTPESLLVGYGPTCAEKLGLPWGAKAKPASVLLAEAAEAAQPTPSPAPEATPEHVAAPQPVTAAQAPQSPVSITEARQRGYARSYREIFGKDA